VYQQKVLACDAQIESVLKRLSSGRGHKDVRADGSSPPRQKGRQSNGLAFDVGGALHFLLGKDLTRKHGIGPYLALKLVSECGDDLSAWPSAKHFTSWLCLAPSNKISGGKVLSSRTRRSGSRAASFLRLAAVAIGRTETALGAFDRRGGTKIGSAMSRVGRSDMSSRFISKAETASSLYASTSLGSYLWQACFRFPCAAEFLIARSPQNFWAALKGAVAGLKR
jgi:Transposase IS116/IS110/IS902 family